MEEFIPNATVVIIGAAALAVVIVYNFGKMIIASLR